MRYAIVFVDGQTARKALELLGSGNLAGQLEGRRLLFDTLHHAQWAQQQLEQEGLVGLTIIEEQIEVL